MDNEFLINIGISTVISAIKKAERSASFLKKWRPAFVKIQLALHELLGEV